MKKNQYLVLKAQLENQKEVLDKRLTLLSIVRLGFLLISVFVIYQCFSFHWVLGGLGAVVLLVGFFYLVKFYEVVEERIEQLFCQLQVIANEIAVAENIRANAYSNGSEYENASHIYSDDLDLFGEHSLFQMINRAKSIEGKRLLAKMMLNDESKKSEIVQRQLACKEMLGYAEWRFQFQASLFLIPNNEPDFTSSLMNISKIPFIKMERFLRFYGKLIPVFWILIFTFSYFTQFAYFGYSVGVMFIFHFFLENLNQDLKEDYLNKISISGRTMKRYAKATELISNQEFSSFWFTEILSDFPKSKQSTKNPIDDFTLIVKRLEIRKNMLASLLLTLYKPYQTLEIIGLGQWLTKNPNYFKRIFNTIAQFEVMASLATVNHNFPGWSFPEILSGSEIYLEAIQVGHPLIVGHTAICNTFTLAANHRLNLVTGSNMSGKSTFLRTLGVNVILAKLGCGVFAEGLKIREGLIPVCYMRIVDAIEQNASTFKAELERIKLVLKALEYPERHLFLIDEMLRGTNSEDKMVGTMALLEKLVQQKAASLVATHDLRLTEISKVYPDKVKNYFFEYSLENQSLAFDYLLKEGVCHSFNASILLANIGLDMHTAKASIGIEKE
jgi:DNA mismatch repair ATPase MutS